MNIEKKKKRRLDAKKKKLLCPINFHITIYHGDTVINFKHPLHLNL